MYHWLKQKVDSKLAFVIFGSLILSIIATVITSLYLLENPNPRIEKEFLSSSLGNPLLHEVLGGPEYDLTRGIFTIFFSAFLFGGAAISRFTLTSPGWDGFRIQSVTYSAAPEVPIPSAVWLFGSGLIGLIGIARRKVNA